MMTDAAAHRSGLIADMSKPLFYFGRIKVLA